jgi:AraC family transcriptional regulator
MFLRIETIEPKKLIGKKIRMTFADNRTPQLWRSFMPFQKEIKNRVSSDLISMQVHDSKIELQNPDVEFEKWAAAEVTDFGHVPEGMETFELQGGLYAVFLHRGPASTGEKTFRYIIEEWLPKSDYVSDIRPHFEIIGIKYKNESIDSEEEIFIPVKLFTDS